MQREPLGKIVFALLQVHYKYAKEGASCRIGLILFFQHKVKQCRLGVALGNADWSGNTRVCAKRNLQIRYESKNIYKAKILLKEPYSSCTWGFLEKGQGLKNVKHIQVPLQTKQEELCVTYPPCRHHILRTENSNLQKKSQMDLKSMRLKIPIY